MTGWVTESQNHRIVGVGRDLCGSSSPTLLPKQGHLQQAAQDLLQAGLEYLQRRRLHNLPESIASRLAKAAVLGYVNWYFRKLHVLES